MGNRVKGRVKKKSIKAAMHSGVGSKRKLSRMGKKQKKDHSGLDATFIGRSACLKRLQITLKDFRRLCILKGIYPRDPLGRVPKNKKGQTFYHLKDIRAIAHEPVLEKFREFRAFMKKIRRAAGRNEKDEAVRKNAIVPTYTLFHLVKERYPRFVDALSDLDDALTLTHLFAALPSEGSIKARVTNKAKSLAASWGAFCATTSAISKSFVSVKGIYMEASIHNVPIRWMIPHSFTQFLPDDVDYNVMQTFFEFYETLLDFVLFKLYNEIGVRYPFASSTMGNKTSTNKNVLLAANLFALENALSASSGSVSHAVSESIKKTPVSPLVKEKAGNGKVTKERSQKLIESLDATLEKVADENSSDEGGDGRDADDDEVGDVAEPLREALMNLKDEEAGLSNASVDLELSDEALRRKRLFADFTFFLSREVPRGYLELVCLSHGGKVGWDGEGSPISESDPRITHHIVDRPTMPTRYEKLPKSREFIQPQWILDCANFMFILPVDKYGVAKSLPPHLSPWVDDEEEGYKPSYAEEIEKLKNGEAADSMEVEGAENKKATEDSEDDEDNGMTEEVEDVDSDIDVQKSHSTNDTKQQKDENHNLAKVMMSKKASKLYDRMQRGISKRKAKAEVLHKRRRELEVANKENSSNKKDSKSRKKRN